jgi:hypothetical protein
MLLRMYIAYIVNFNNPLESQLKLKVTQNFATAAVIMLYIMLKYYICILPYDLLLHTTS